MNEIERDREYGEYGGPQVDAKQGQVLNGVDRLEKTAMEMGEQLDILVGRLGPVLGPDSPEVVPGGSDREQYSPVADRLNRCADRLAGYTAQVRYLLNRLEV